MSKIRCTIWAVLICATASCGKDSSQPRTPIQTPATTGEEAADSVICPGPEHWPTTEDGIIVNWLGNFVLNGEEYSPFQSCTDGGYSKETRSFTVSVRRAAPPDEYSQIMITPGIRVWVEGHPVTYQKTLPKVPLKGDSDIVFRIDLDDLPASIQARLGELNLNCEIGYLYAEKWKTCFGSNFIYTPAAQGDAGSTRTIAPAP